MINNTEIKDLSEDAIRQHIDARQTFIAFQQAKERALAFRGGMIWKTVKSKDYLVRTTTRANQTGLGARSSVTEAIYQKFTQGKRQSEQTIAAMKAAIERHQRLNRALRVGRTPNIIVEILSALDSAGMADNFTVIGTNALYAYETAASARIEESVLATRDFDLLWDNRKKLSLAIQDGTIKDGPLAEGMIGFLRRIDPSFIIRDDQLYTAVNKDGYEVDILRRMGRGSEHEPARFTDHEDDFWVVKARNADWLLSAPKFKEMVISTNGKMAYMNTVDPRAFALFKLWMAEQKDREYGKRLRDAAQASVVVDLINERLPQFSFEDIKIFPTSVNDMLIKR
jgi:hypothetical protein